MKIPKLSGLDITPEEWMTIDQEFRGVLYFSANAKKDYVRGIHLIGSAKRCVDIVNTEIRRFSCSNFCAAWHWEAVKKRVCSFYGLPYRVGGRACQ